MMENADFDNFELNEDQIFNPKFQPGKINASTKRLNDIVA